MDFINGSAKHEGEFVEWGQRVKSQLIAFKAPMIISILGRHIQEGREAPASFISSRMIALTMQGLTPGAPSALHGPATPSDKPAASSAPENGTGHPQRLQGELRKVWDVDQQLNVAEMDKRKRILKK